LRRTGAKGELYAPDEEYLDVAVTHLLPEYYGAHADEGTGAVLRGLAERLITRHGDRWLADALKTPHSASAGAAFAALGRAEMAAQGWDYPTAGVEAGKAMPLFQSAGGAAGMMFARIEQVFALDWNGQGQACVQMAGSLLEPLHARAYAWLEAQAMLEGGCATWMGDNEHADQSESRGRERALNDHYPVLYLRALGLNASGHAIIGNGATAWQENFKGLAIYWAGKYPLLRAHQFYSNLAQLAQQIHNTYSAVAWARELASIDRILQDFGNKNVYGPTLWRLGMAELDAGFKDDANHDLQRSVAIDSRMQSGTRTQIDLAALETTHGDLNTSLSRLLHVQTAAERDDGLLGMQFEAEFGRLQLRRRDYGESKKRFEEARRIGDRSWSRASEEDRLPWLLTMGNIYRGLVECEIKTGADPRQSRALWSQYKARLFARGGTIAPAQDSLPPGEARLSFADLPSGLATWLETDHGLSFRWIESTEPLYTSVGRLARGCASEGSPAAVVRANARDLSQKLLGTWDRQLDSVRTLILETDGPIARVPWLALVRENGHYWSDDIALRIRAGASDFVAKARVSSDTQALVVGAPALSGQEGLAPLTNALAEAEKVSGFFSRATSLTGRSALLSRVRERLVQAQLFHFTGHGYGGEGGGLLLRGTEGGRALLRAADIQDLDLSHCSLVVLAGCSTAAGERGGPGDPRSLVRAFLRAGAADVVAGLWDLDSDGTQMLVGKFYESLLSGSKADESLCMAAATVRSDSRYTHPYYWAGLEVFSSN